MARLFVCGDIVNDSPNLSFVGSGLSKVIREADYSICNFEGPELRQGQSATCPHQINGTSAFLSSLGFNMMLLANNHITELGADGVQHSIDVIKASGSEYIGAGLSWEEAYKPIIRVIKEFRFGFINVCEAQVGQFVSPKQSFGYAWMGYDSFFEDIKTLSKDVDYVIVFVHAGLEHYDVPLPEIRSLYHRICDSGASVVVGSHPHCAQGYEYYGEKPIIYSLGNFFFPLRKRWPNEAHSYSVVLDFSREKQIVLHPVFHHNTGTSVELEDDGVMLETLCSKLGSDYEKWSSETIDKAYNGLCRNLLLEATCGQDERDGYKAIIRKLIDYSLHRKTNVLQTSHHRDALLLRLFENETYRWVITRYLKNN